MQRCSMSKKDPLLHQYCTSSICISYAQRTGWDITCSPSVVAGPKFTVFGPSRSCNYAEYPLFKNLRPLREIDVQMLKYVTAADFVFIANKR